MSDRKYALRKLAAGDYLLQGNDARSIWRLRACDDVAASAKDSSQHINIRVWEVFRWTGDLGDYIDPDLAKGWQCMAAGMRTRKEAIEEALLFSAPLGGVR